jgi:hypothetical protein
MKRFLAKYDYFLCLLGLFGLCLLIVNPTGDFPLNDDWSYSKSVAILYKDNLYNIGEWAAMTLFTHIMWGYLFVKAFGFSFFVLRISTYVSCIIGMWFMSKLVLKITSNKWLAFFTCLILLFNPIFFSLGNTFMTDINYNTLLILSIYFAHDFFQSGRLLSYVMVFVFSTLLVLLRQFGITVPVCFAFATLFYQNKKWWYTLGAFALTIGVYLIFKQYENYLKSTLQPYAAYKYSGSFNLFEEKFWDDFFYNFNRRARLIAVYVLVFISPMTAIFLIDLIKKIKIHVIVPTILFTVFLVLLLCSELRFPLGNIFSGMALGPETFCQSWQSDTYNSSVTFTKVVDAAKYILTFISALAINFRIILFIQNKNFSSVVKPWHIFIPLVFCCYVLMIFISVSYFDRYHVPLITIALIYLSSMLFRFKTSYIPATIIVGCFFYVAVPGTKDYFTLNSKRWEAYHYLKNKDIPTSKINGGFEINCWNDGEINWWVNFYETKGYDYLIQFSPAPNFRPLKEYEFQRYFPYKKDKIYIFAREGVSVPE